MAGRSNDFRPDPLIKTGSAVERDYLIKDTLANGTYKYDGFGFDRGHLAPSADFRWSKKALSESFYYSNMSPQVADFNRDSWAKLEDLLRAYVQEKKVPLYVLTAPLLRPNLPRIERGVNHVAIPVYYYKIALDPVNRQAIAFLMPNKKCEYPTEHYAVSIDSLEHLTGRDFYPSLPDSLENELEKMDSAKPWMKLKEKNDEKPLDPTQLPKKHFNTVQAKLYQNQNEIITVCGTVVSTKLSSKGNVFLNLDKGFPNQIFTITIFKDQLVNFTYAPQVELMGKVICVEGKVADFNGTPSMVIEHEKSVRLYLEEEER
jgi:endonuclease G